MHVGWLNLSTSLLKIIIMGKKTRDITLWKLVTLVTWITAYFTWWYNWKKDFICTTFIKQQTQSTCFQLFRQNHWNTLLSFMIFLTIQVLHKKNPLGSPCSSLCSLHTERLLPLAHTSINNYSALKLTFGKLWSVVNFLLHEKHVSGYPVV